MTNDDFSSIFFVTQIEKAMTKTPILSAILLMLAFSELYSEDTPFNFMRNTSNARAAALSGAFVSMTDDAGAVFYNPASIYTVEDKNLSVTFLKHVLDINSGNVSYIYDESEIGTFAGSVSFTSYGSFDYYDDQGNPLGGTFGANDMMLGVSYSNILDTNLYYGVTLKFAYMTLEKYSTSALAVDAGLLYKLKDGRTNLGLSVLHAGGQLSKIGGVPEDLPLDIRLGANHRLRGLPLLVNFNFHHLADRSESFFDKFKNFSLGGELYIGKYIQLRLGYNNHVRTETASDADKGITGFSGGLGINVDSFNFDYGYSQYGSNANMHRFSVGLGL